MAQVTIPRRTVRRCYRQVVERLRVY